MPPPTKLPAALLTELGRVVVIWAYIEQDVLLQASAMAAQATDGHPRDFLRVSFKKLRQTWYRLCRENFDARRFADAHGINNEIARLAQFRHHAIHGTWRVIGRGEYHLSIWEQRQSLERLEAAYSLRELRGLVLESLRLAHRVSIFARGEPGAVDTLNALVPNEIGIEV